MAPAAGAAMMSALVDATVQGCQRGQDQKQQSVRSGVQSKVEKTVDQHREATGQCSRGHAAPKLVVRFAAGASLAQKNYQKSNPQKAPHEAPLCKGYPGDVV